LTIRSVIGGIQNKLRQPRQAKHKSGFRNIGKFRRPKID
jgi:hypothetical protein